MHWTIVRLATTSHVESVMQQQFVRRHASIYVAGAHHSKSKLVHRLQTACLYEVHTPRFLGTVATEDHRASRARRYRAAMINLE